MALSPEDIQRIISGTLSGGISLAPTESNRVLTGSVAPVGFNNTVSQQLMNQARALKEQQRAQETSFQKMAYQGMVAPVAPMVSNVNQKPNTPVSGGIPSATTGTQNTAGLSPEDRAIIDAWKGSSEYNKVAPSVGQTSSGQPAINIKDYLRPGGGVRLGKAVTNSVLDAYTQNIGWNKPEGGTVSMGSIPDQLRYDNQVPLSSRQSDYLTRAAENQRDLQNIYTGAMAQLRNTMETTKDARVFEGAAGALAHLAQTAAGVPKGLSEIAMVEPMFSAGERQRLWERYNIPPKDIATVEAMKAQAQRDKLQGELAVAQKNYLLDPKNPETVLNYFKAVSSFYKPTIYKDAQGERTDYNLETVIPNALFRSLGINIELPEEKAATTPQTLAPAGSNKLTGTWATDANGNPYFKLPSQ